MSTMAIAVCPKDEPLPPWRIESPPDIGSDLWINSKFKDFQIMIDDRVIDVHKCVLAARSPVFSAMLTSGMSETKSGQLIIEDFDYDIVQHAIWFIYSERFATNYTTRVICELLRFGHKYDIHYLINSCLSQIDFLRLKYDSFEIKFLIKSAEDLGSNGIMNTIKSIFEKDHKLDYYHYLTIEDDLFKDDLFKDLKIICDDGVEFSVHKCILALKSPVFAQMLDKMTENGDTSGQLQIDRIKSVVIEYVIEFFYPGCLTSDVAFYRNPDLIIGLLEFADRFQVENLAIFCLQKINEEKYNLGKEVILTYIQNAGNFKSKKIFELILGIFGTRSFDPFDFKKAFSESYWN